jgi:hypothetical protein
MRSASELRSATRTAPTVSLDPQSAPLSSDNIINYKQLVQRETRITANLKYVFFGEHILLTRIYKGI